MTEIVYMIVEESGHFISKLQRTQIIWSTKLSFLDLNLMFRKAVSPFCRDMILYIFQKCINNKCLFVPIYFRQRNKNTWELHGVDRQACSGIFKVRLER